MVIATIAWFWLPAGPGSAWFLNAEERKFAVERITKDSAKYVAYERGSGEQRLTRRDVVETAKDWKLWYVLVFNICASVPSQAFSVFLPLVVEGLGYSSIEANLVSRQLSSCQEYLLLIKNTLHSAATCPSEPEHSLSIENTISFSSIATY